MLVLGGGLLALAWVTLAFAYTAEQNNVSGTVVANLWQRNPGTVTWSLNPSGTSNVNTAGGLSVEKAIEASFATWTSSTLNGQSLVSLSVSEGAPSAEASPNAGDCISTIGFADNNSSDFATGVIAFTAIYTAFGTPGSGYPCANPPTTRTCALASCIIDADMEFNPRTSFATGPAVPGRYDLQAIATHEAGHFLGLDHSGIAHAMMYPYADAGVGQQRNLSTDDIVGIADLYPNPTFASATGAITGTIRQNGSGIFAAHVVAVDSTGAAVVDGLSDPAGDYKLVGVPPGKYTLFVEPLAGPYDITSFYSWACGYGDTSNQCTQVPPNPTNYTGTFY